jgi:23S rRNA (cytidine1920-2'-O)/16S rRNA (cytidine1409-2'-O)-methyltransferase
MIMAGDVLIDDIVILQPGTLCMSNCRVRIKQKKSKFVSRGGDKLAGFLKDSALNVQDKCSLDVGISTGGFTDVLLRNNALHVCGVDVGYGILEFQLRKNTKLSLLERTNAREVTETELNQVMAKSHLTTKDINLVVMDVSFISVFSILPNLIHLLNSDTDYIILIKPQFEADKHMIDFGGIVSNSVHIKEITDRVQAQFKTLGFETIHTAPSCLTGAKGNQEIFYHVRLAQ